MLITTDSSFLIRNVDSPREISCSKGSWSNPFQRPEQRANSLADDRIAGKSASKSRYNAMIPFIASELLWERYHVLLYHQGEGPLNRTVANK